jgi:hypothetical protein
MPLAQCVKCPLHDRFGRAAHGTFHARTPAQTPAASRRTFLLVAFHVFPYTILSATPRTNDKRVGAPEGFHGCGEVEIESDGRRSWKGQWKREWD